MNSSLLRQLRSGSVWALIGKVFSSVATLLTLALLTRLLSRHDFGTYALLANTLVFLAAIGGWGMTSSVVREVAAAPDPASRALVIRVAFLLTVGISSVLGLLLYVVVFVANRSGMQSVWDAGSTALLCLWLIVTCVQGVIGEAFRGLEDIPQATLFTGALATFLGVAAIFLLSLSGLEANLTQILWIFILSGLLAALLGVWRLQARTHFLFPGRMATPSSGQGRLPWFLKVSTPFLVINVMNFIFTQTDIWILGLSVPREEVALYAAAARLVLFVVAPLVVSNAVLPGIVARLYQQGQVAELEMSVRRLSTAAALPALLALVVLIVGGPTVLGLFYGPEYRAAYPVLLLLSIGQFSVVCAGSATLVLAMTHHQDKLLHVNVVAAISAVGLGLLLTRTYGMTGMAFTMMLVWTVSQWVMVWQARRLTGVWTHIQPGLLTLFWKRRHSRRMSS